MRLLAVNSTRIWGGAEVFFQILCTAMADRGHEVTLVCHPDSELRRRIIGDDRIRIAPLAIRAELNYFRSLQLATILHDVRPDVLLAHRPKDVKISSVARWLAKGMPIVHLKLYGEPLKSRFDFRFFWKREVDAMVAASHETFHRLREDAPWLGDMPVEVIHNAVDTNRFRPLPELRERARAQLGNSHDVLVVSYHGRLAPPKRVDLAVRAIAAAARQARVRGLIIGDGPEGRALRELAIELEAPVTFVGFRDDVPDLLAGCDVEITMSEIEGSTPMSVLEAMACGLPVIASDATSHPEAVEEGCGALVEPGTPEGAAKAILALADDPAKRRAKGEAARARAVEQFGIDKMIDRYEAFIRQVIGRGQAQSRS
jgi:glycosyltransferase involved in cell wall biosynthesis